MKKIKHKFLNWAKTKILSVALKIIFEYVYIFPYDLRMEIESGKIYGSKISLTIAGKNGANTEKIFSILTKKAGN